VVQGIEEQDEEVLQQHKREDIEEQSIEELESAIMHNFIRAEERR
jgi:hypothetical protein